MRRYRKTLAEQETIILWDNESEFATVYTHDQRIGNKLKALSEKFPDQFFLKKKGMQRDVTYQIPKKCVSIRSPYSEKRRLEQVQEAIENGVPFHKDNTEVEDVTE